jgi:hypothetical protein
MGVVEVWRESSGFWRWRYTEPPSEGREELELFSNEVYETLEAATEAASNAYPGVPLLELERPPGAPPEPDRRAGRRRLRRRVLVVLGATLALLALRRRRRHGANG